ncbi:MAG: SDR family oxidoreductase [Leadbetterella sp.]|nr:SDR family oxidoreductase [Leadbetterella sp.]
MSEIKGSVFWITGASSGIGEATALAAAKQGARLVLSARRKEELERVKKATGLAEEEVLVLPLDMEKPAEIQPAVDAVLAKFGRIDILFNNAGVSQRSSVLDTRMEVFERIMTLNYLAVVALTKAVLPVMIRQNSGHLLVTSSISGKLGSPMRAGYCGSKHALHGFFDALRSEVYDHNIRVLVVCPGYIKTDVSINALASDGGKHGKMDDNQNQGISAEVCAEKILQGIRRNRDEIYIGGKEVMGVYLKRFFPGLLNRIVRKQAPK